MDAQEKANEIFNARQEALKANPETVPQIVPQPPVPVKRNFLNKKIVLIFGAIFGILVLVGVLVKASSLVKNSQEVKLTWWVIDEDKEALDPIIKAYTDKNPKVKIEVLGQSGQDYRERLINSLSQGNGPDIYEFHNNWVPVLINNLSPSHEDFSSIFYPVITSNLKTQNGFVGVPLEYDGIGLFLNQDIFNTYGKNFPKTWDDLRRVAQQLTIRDQNGNIKQSGAALGVTGNIDYWPDIIALLNLQNGADLANPATTRGQSALTFFTDFSKVDHVWDDTLPGAQTYFSQGKLAMYFGRYRDVFNIKLQNPNLRFAISPIPQLPGTDPTSYVSYANYWVSGVSSKSTNSAVAWDFLKFMVSQENLRELSKNEKRIRGYGNLYPRVDMQKEILSDPFAGAFIYQANFARSWYLSANTFDGATGINSQVAQPYKNAIDNANLNTTVDKALQDAQTSLMQVLGAYGIR